jgi:hypothetical protein
MLGMDACQPRVEETRPLARRRASLKRQTQAVLPKRNLGQVERLRAMNARGRYSLWTGDVGTALFAAACLDEDARYPILDIV